MRSSSSSSITRTPRWRGKVLSTRPQGNCPRERSQAAGSAQETGAERTICSTRRGASARSGRAEKRPKRALLTEGQVGHPFGGSLAVPAKVVSIAASRGRGVSAAGRSSHARRS
jgi:hypothetical protein